MLIGKIECEKERKLDIRANNESRCLFLFTLITELNKIQTYRKTTLHTH